MKNEITPIGEYLKGIGRAIEKLAEPDRTDSGYIYYFQNPDGINSRKELIDHLHAKAEWVITRILEKQELDESLINLTRQQEIQLHEMMEKIDKAKNEIGQHTVIKAEDFTEPAKRMNEQMESDIINQEQEEEKPTRKYKPRKCDKCGDEYEPKGPRGSTCEKCRELDKTLSEIEENKKKPYTPGQ